MKKIPTLFKKQFTEDGTYIGVSNEVTDGMEWVLNGDGVATVKWDGSACAIIDGKFYKRYDAKRGKKPPQGAIQCCEPDPITGHHPHWVKVDFNEKADKWFVEAYNYSTKNNTVQLNDGTYEAIGLHFLSNPYGLECDCLIPHGVDIVEVERSWDGIKQYLESHFVEGIVFWKDGEPQCKIRKKDYKLPWK